MPMLLPRFNRTPAVTGAFCLVLATLLTACASKNPLMEEPAPRASASPQAAPAVTPPEEKAEAKPVVSTENSAPEASVAVTAPVTPAEPAPTAAATPAKSGAATGVQTSRTNRFLGIFRPYRPDIQQGNFVSQEMVAQLKPGMTQDQVVFLLGTPLLNDMFHAERWDYAFRLQKGNGEITTSRVTVFFKDKLVSSFEGGGDLPTEKDYLERIADKAKAANK